MLRDLVLVHNVTNTLMSSDCWHCLIASSTSLVARPWCRYSGLNLKLFRYIVFCTLKYSMKKDVLDSMTRFCLIQWRDLGGNIDSHSEFDQAINPHILPLCLYMLQYVLHFVETDVHTINRMFHRSLWEWDNIDLPMNIRVSIFIFYWVKIVEHNFRLYFDGFR